MNMILALFDAIASSNKIPKDIEDNIARGRAAMRTVLKTRQDFQHAMYRRDLGWIDFVWGDVGVVRPNGKTKGGKGIAHIIEARMRKDAYSKMGAHALLYRLVTTIARGKVLRTFEKSISKQTVLEYQGYEVTLIKTTGNEWLLSGWKVFD
ncbi:putative barnase/colicin E5 family endoribonuclease [Acinetobacter rathckeae]|uniref:putative barnase/colicin E5 family endoribonuclease n=1 Tax=Acinetobacter rathckeae TaxID=2605272 RepID=UPI0018A333DD|nr:hypothetical protein [Acinetobacter rathckeae]MBF7696189.1 hypothetical protein [Acinetobacter rathckeae]